MKGTTDALKTSFDATVAAKRISDKRPIGHDGVNAYGGRQKVTRNSLQLGINEAKTTVFVDIDYFNPEKRGFLRHLFLEVLRNRFTGSTTNPFRVGRGLGSDLTRYLCTKKKN